MERLQESRVALGSQALLTLVLEDAGDVPDLFADLWREVSDFEERFSRFIADSELSRFNAGAGRSFKVSSQFRDLLVACHELSLETGGLFNPFILPGLQTAGYVGSWLAPRDFKTSQDYRHRKLVVPIDELVIGKNSARIPADSALEFGGIGKGYLLDQLSAYLRAKGCDNYWLSLGGDVICSGRDVDGQPWSVGVQDALSPAKSIGVLTNEGGARLAIATSGITKRKGVKDGQSWHHIINPCTGRPARTDLLTATVSAPDATRADVYAKCLVILGSEGARHFAMEHSIRDMYLQTATESWSL